MADTVQPVSLLIHELATNAVKYGALSAATGQINISWRILPTGELALHWTESDGPPVWEPKNKGFGSTLVKEVTTRQLFGRLEVNWPEAGMNLVATLPKSVYRRANSPRSALGDEAEPKPAAAGSSGRVLLVEDEALIAMELCSDLESLGWEIVGPAATAEEAMQLMNNAPLPDAAILDVNLGGKMVYPFAEWLQQRGVPFLFCTGYEQFDDDHRDRNWKTVRKPVSIDLLDGELRRLQQSA
jgi:CheY-like chemotaxis protein